MKGGGNTEQGEGLTKALREEEEEEKKQEEEESAALTPTPPPQADTHLAQHGEAGRVQIGLLQLDHAHPAVLVQVLLLVAVAQAQRVHLGRRERGRQGQVTIGLHGVITQNHLESL